MLGARLKRRPRAVAANALRVCDIMVASFESGGAPS
jgi:hypothetical protein